jgi:Cof subfamily protein (haloacid dehalogenase superfamily)
MPYFKILVLDLDGTLLRDDESISSNTEQLLKEIHNFGITIVLATGRSFLGLPKKVLCLDFVDFLISSNGASLFKWDTNQRLFSSWISKEIAIDVLSKIKDVDCVADLLIEGKWHIDENKFSEMEKIVPNNVFNYLKKTRILEKNMLDLCLNLNCGVEKIVINFSDLKVKQKIISLISEIKEKDSIKYWTDKNYKIDFYNAQTSKANALKFLCQKLNVDPSSVMAFGNDDNDIELFDFAGDSIAMKNSTKLLLEKSKHITEDNNNDGIYKYLVSFLKEKRYS